MKFLPRIVNVSEILVVILSVVNYTRSDDVMDPESSLECYRRPYKYNVTQTDSNGRTCWDIVMVMSCWGRCDSSEIGEWRFPYKKSFHPVCIHGRGETRTAWLSNCEEGAQIGTSIYKYVEALECKCALCNPDEVNCQGLRYVGQRRDVSGFLRG